MTGASRPTRRRLAGHDAGPEGARKRGLGGIHPHTVQRCAPGTRASPWPRATPSSSAAPYQAALCQYASQVRAKHPCITMADLMTFGAALGPELAGGPAIALHPGRGDAKVKATRWCGAAACRLGSKRRCRAWCDRWGGVLLLLPACLTSQGWCLSACKGPGPTAPTYSTRLPDGMFNGAGARMLRGSQHATAGCVRASSKSCPPTPRPLDAA